jgi:hypothetical protein
MSDDFGMSSEDEDELLAVAEEATTGKRSLDLNDGITGNAQKRAKSSNGAAKPVSASVRLANDVLKGRFGLDGFRLEQEAAITRILDGGSAVVVFPTGGGKSLCYQVTYNIHTLNEQSEAKFRRYQLFAFVTRTKRQGAGYRRAKV